jgi:hypothetical protein
VKFLILMFVFLASQFVLAAPQSLDISGVIRSPVSSLNSSIDGTLTLKKIKDDDVRYEGKLKFISESGTSSTHEVEMRFKTKKNVQTISIRFQDIFVRYEFSRLNTEILSAPGETVALDGKYFQLKKIIGPQEGSEWKPLAIVTGTFVLEY